LSCVDCVWNVMAHVQEPDFIFRQKRTSPFKSMGASVQSTTGSQDVHISDGNAGYTMFQGSVKSTGYPLHSPVSPSLPLPCVTVCHHVSAGLYITVWKNIVTNTEQDASLWDNASEFVFGYKITDVAPVQLVRTYSAAQDNTNTIWVSISSVFKYLH